MTFKNTLLFWRGRGVRKYVYMYIIYMIDDPVQLIGC